MKTYLHAARLLPVLALTLGAVGAASGQALTDADEIVRRANLAAFYAGADGRSEARMIIRDAQGRGVEQARCGG